MPAIRVSVKQETLHNLETAVRRTGWNESQITDEALTKYLAELEEDAEDARLADEAYVRFMESGGQAIPAEEVYRELGL